MTDENYYKIQGWMLNKLDLKSYELSIYAVIYSFSHDGKGRWNGSITRMSEWTGAGRRTVIEKYENLVAQKLVKKDYDDDGKIEYYANLEALKMTAKELQKLRGKSVKGSAKTALVRKPHGAESAPYQSFYSSIYLSI